MIQSRQGEFMPRVSLRPNLILVQFLSRKESCLCLSWEEGNPGNKNSCHLGQGYEATRCVVLDQLKIYSQWQLLNCV